MTGDRPVVTSESGSIRIDKLLWYLRLAKTRSLAQRWVGEGHIRLNGQRVEKANQQVSPGDVMVIPIGQSVRVIELVALPIRRGPATEAQSCYRMLDDGAPSPLAGGETAKPKGLPEQ